MKSKSKKKVLINDVSNFKILVEEIGNEKSISAEVINNILITSLERAYERYVNGDVKLDEIGLASARVKVEIDEKENVAKFYQIKTIKKDVEDDMLEIEMEDAKEIFPNENLAYDTDVEIQDTDFDMSTNNVFIRNFRHAFNAQLSEAEKTVLYDNYKDRMGELVIGEVTKVEENGSYVNIGNNSVYLPRRELIGDEIFNIGQQIKVYLADVSRDGKGNIMPTRAHVGFVKCLFEEEIREVYDGTVEIKNIVRRAGKRCKVAVASKDLDVDPVSSCIGKDGTRINKVLNQITGNGRDKEKIDIIPYSENPELYIVESLRPAEVVGVVIDIDEENHKEAICVVKDGEYTKAVGLKGINVNLAVNLTGYDLTILEESEAVKEGLKYKLTEELRAEEATRLDQARKTEFAKHTMQFKAEQEKEEELKKVEANRITSHEEAIQQKAARKAAKEAKTPTPSSALPRASSLEEELAKAKAFANKAEQREAEHVEIKTTTTNVLDLEKQLENQQKEAKKAVEKKATHKAKKTTEEPEKPEEKTEQVEEQKDVQKMDIYTEEELREIEAEENDNVDEEAFDDEDVDYDEYDDYYDEED